MGTGSLQQLYATYLTTRADWTRDHCALAAAEVCQAQIGIDPIAAIRHRVIGKRESLRFLREFGDDPIEARRKIAEELCGWIPIRVQDALPGDVGTVTTVYEGAALEVAACRTSRGWFVRMEEGFSVVPTATRAWRVLDAAV